MADRFELIMAEVETGIILDAQGQRAHNGDRPFRPRFATREAALKFKDDLLSQFPYAEVRLYDLFGNMPSECFTDEAGFERYSTEMATWRKWRYSFWLFRLLTAEPPNPRPDLQ
jgi:hypothetical protein